MALMALFAVNSGTGGIVAYHGSYQQRGNSIAIEPSSHRIFVTGHYWADIVNFQDMAIWCYEPDGNPCADFGAGGLCFITMRQEENFSMIRDGQLPSIRWAEFWWLGSVWTNRTVLGGNSIWSSGAIFLRLKSTAEKSVNQTLSGELKVVC